MWKVVRDDRTPACLPRWAQDEIVDLRIRWEDLLRENLRLQQELAIAQGASKTDAAMSALKGFHDRV